MNKKTLESLVPSLDLCKRIQNGAFADSALVHARIFTGHIVVVPREAAIENDWDILCSAPTLAEIFAQLPQTSTVTWFTPEEYPNEFAVCCYVLQPKPRKPKLKSEIDDNPAAAALKLWLELLESK